MVASTRVDARVAGYVLLSDIHLGADIVEHVRPWSRNTWLREQAAVDLHIEGLFDHYVSRADGPLRFVIAGDFVDFIGMSVSPPRDERVRLGLTSDERSHGLGSTAEHAALKMKAVAARHERAFRAIARALLCGHSLAIVRGNHDIEWHWGRARRALVDTLCAFAETKDERRRIRANIEFHAWFYYVPGLLYVEHGHEYDPMCSYGDPLSPVCARDRRRIRFTPSHALMRYVARPSPGLSTFGHEHATFFTYMRVAASLGCRGSIRLFLRFLHASLRLVGGALLYQRHGAHLERTKPGRLRAFGRRHGIDAEVVLSLLRLHTTPVATSVGGVFKSLYLDRVALIALTLLMVVGAFSSVPSGDAAELSVFSALCACLIGMVTGRGRKLDPTERMARGAGEIARTLGVRYVVMGHTHTPCFDRVGENSFYVNLGNWGEDELHEDRKGRAVEAPCTFLELDLTDAAPRARLMRWVGGGRSLVLLHEPGRATSCVPDLTTGALLTVE